MRAAGAEARVMRIALLADTHLTPLELAFDDNLAAARRWITGQDIPITIHLGDVTADGLAQPRDLRHAAGLLDDWPGALHIVAGNHDVGDNPGSGHAVADADAIARFAQLAGAGRWRINTGRWTLLGMNAQLFGRGDHLEAEQTRWLDSELECLEARVGLFLHKPLFRHGPGDCETHHRYVPGDARARLLERLARVDLRFVVSGHTHQSRSILVDGIEHVWIPSAAFVLPDTEQERIGAKEVGMTVLTLKQDRHHFETFRPEGMTMRDITDHAHVYPAFAERLREIADARDR